MEEQFSRTCMMIGEDGLQKLSNAHVIVFGVGGVGGYVIEGLARSGVGTITIVDHDTVAPSNLNRQIIALHNTIGMSKVDCMEERIHAISPQCVVHKRQEFYLPEQKELFALETYDYIVDAIDTVTAKIDLVVRAKELGVPIMCSMGTGNKTKPAMLEVTDLYKTSICPLAKVMRKELRVRGISSLKVVYSKEEPKKHPVEESPDGKRKKQTPGSMVYVPAVAGMIIASEVINDLLSK